MLFIMARGELRERKVDRERVRERLNVITFDHANL